MFKQNNLCVREIALEAQHILGARSAPGIDHLVIVAYHADIAQPFMMIVGAKAEQADKFILWQIAILELIYMQIVPATLVTLQHFWLASPQLLRKHKQIVEVHAIIGAQQLLVELIDARRHLFYIFARLLRHLIRAIHLIFRA